ncbi:ATP-binding cassette domain-containing protein [Nakamurella endophytica]|uniref:ABC transporter domain-containing protein n=1 Tax=Nakamurella endophytica TaxID=1748367 RepID=A0A917SQ91_9ACTN|nr:ATP-binding cassette domain-containing protein [Nakamurella endophytica]GGL90909.1 hypothetical protein GCM10011594_08240 [Nakamurella endophytica]
MTAARTGPAALDVAADVPVALVDDVFVAFDAPAGPVMALRGVTLRIRAGERLLLQGPNGSGKSTLLRVVTGEQAVTAGSVHVAGEELTGMSAADRRRWRARHIGIIDQHARRSLLPEWPVVDNVALQLRLLGAGPDAGRAAALETLDRFGLADLARRPVGTLSGGEAQRVAICAAVAHRPTVVLADEPTGELDEDAADRVYEQLSQAGRTPGSCLVLVSHDRRAQGVADRAVRIRDGRVAEQWWPGGPPGAAAEQQVVDPRGWLRLPASLLGPLTATSTVFASAGPGGEIVLRPAPAAPRPDDAGDRPTDPPAGAARPGVAAPAPAGETVPPPGSAAPGPAGVIVPPRLRPAAVPAGVGAAGLSGNDPVVAVLPGGAVGPPLLALHRVTARFGGRVLFEDLDLAVHGGEVVVLRGPSGSGKSTVLALAAALTDPAAGHVQLCGTPVASLSRADRARLRGRCAAVVLQQTVLTESLTVRENVVLAADVHRAARSDAAAPPPGSRPDDQAGARRRRPAGHRGGSDGTAAPVADAAQWAEQLRLTRLLDQPVRSCSGGERQRTALARALVAGTPLVVLDEPTSQQDEASAALVTAVIAAEARRGRGVLVATHDAAVAAVADRVVTLGRGRHGATDGRTPQHPQGRAGQIGSA